MKERVIKEFDINIKQDFYDPYLPQIKGDHRVTLLVGDSGSGKSSYLRENNLNWGFEIDESKLVIDLLAEVSSYDDAKDTLRKFRLNSIPTWIQTYKTLSNGEKLRVELAYKYLTQDVIIIDEFTSMIDRFTAFTICKSIRRDDKKKFILATCHHDIINVLKPSCVIEFNQKHVYEANPTLEEIVNVDIDENIDSVGTYGISY